MLRPLPAAEVAITGQASAASLAVVTYDQGSCQVKVSPILAVALALFEKLSCSVELLCAIHHQLRGQHAYLVDRCNADDRAFQS